MISRRNRGLQRLEGLQEVTRGNKGLRRGYKRVQKVTRGYRK